MIQSLLRWIAGLVVLGVVVGLGYTALFTGSSSIELTAHFSRSTGLYTGDDVRVLGVKVGAVDSVDPGPEYVTVRFHVDGVDVPAGVKAAIVAPNLVTSRFVQLAPAYTSGPKLHDDATIGLDHTAEPIEWDELKVQLTRLAKSLAPTATDQAGALSGAVDTADANLTGSAAQLHSMLHSLSQATETLAANRGNLFGTIRGLQSFVAALVDSDSSVRAFSAKLDSVSGLLAQNRTSLATALDELDGAVGELTAFVKQNRSSLKSSLDSVSTLTATLTAKQYQIADLLHVTPTALDNFYNIVDPRYHAATGTIAVANFDDMAQLVCRAIVSTGGTVDNCLKILNPLLQQLGLSTLPLSIKQAIEQGAAKASSALPSKGSKPSGSSGAAAPKNPIQDSVGGLLGLLLPGGGT